MSDVRHSVINLYHDIPFDSNYNHTVLFPDKLSQDTYFNSKKLLTVTQYTTMSYLRHTRGTIRIQSKMSLLTNCNYIGFFNPERYPRDDESGIFLDYEDVDFYAFVDSIEYINENTVEISYSIDHIQTWMFYYDLNPCYVEREHVRDDSIGANRVKEGLDGGDYVISGFENLDYWGWEHTGTYDLTQTGFVVLATQPFDADSSTTPKPKIVNGIYGTLTVYTCINSGEFNDLLINYANGATKDFSPIIAVYQIPGAYLTSGTGSGLRDYIQTTLGLDAELGMGGFRNWNPITGAEDLYIPLNNKMYTHPYNFLMLESPDGSSVQLKYENFQHFPDADHHLSFLIYLAVFPEPETMCLPVNYESTQFMANLRSALCSKAYPTVPLASSAFQAWWAQNRYSMPIVDAFVEGNETARALMEQTGSTAKWDEYLTTALDAMKNMATTPSSALQLSGKGLQVTGSATTWTKFGAGGIKEAGNIMVEVGEQLASRANHKAIPNTTATKANNGGITHQTHTDCYKVYYTQIRPEYARIIDRYFSTYGYAIHYVKEPDITSRVVWNYIKTVGCTIRTNASTNRFVPLEAEKAICAIYDRGITFWHWPELIHQYVHRMSLYGEENMYNPIGEPYNWPGQPGYPNYTPPAPTPLPTGTNIYFKTFNWTNGVYVMGIRGNNVSPVYQMNAVTGLSNVYSINGSTFDQYDEIVFLNKSSATAEGVIISNVYNKKSTTDITGAYYSDNGVSHFIGSYYIGTTNPYTIPITSENYIFFQTYKGWTNTYINCLPKQGNLDVLMIMSLVSGFSTVFKCKVSSITEMAATHLFQYNLIAFANNSEYSQATLSNVYNLNETSEPITVYDVRTNEPIGAYFIGPENSNPFSDTPVIPETNKIYFQFASSIPHVYVFGYNPYQMTYSNAIELPAITGTGIQQNVYGGNDISALDGWSFLVFSNSTTPSTNPVNVSEVVNKTTTSSPQQINLYGTSSPLGSYYIGTSNPFTT